MYRIIDSRGSGKTSRLMLLAKEQDATIVCSNPYAMEEKAHRYGFTGLKFMSYYTFINEKHDKYEKFLIDELELLMKDFNNQIIGYSLSNED